MTAVVGIIAQGEMGAAFGTRFAGRGLEVRTVLEGRSLASAKRAAAAGMRPVSWEDVADVDLFLSLVPPSEALPLAERMAPCFATLQRRPLYVDLNAISPRTAEAVAAVITTSGCAFADGSICGHPPGTHGLSPAIYASGPGAAAFGEYRKYDLDIRVLDAPVGAASAVKICQAGMTKGCTALASIMILAASRYGIGEVVSREIRDSHAAGLYEFLQPAMLRMFDKAHRFEGEMQEISEFLDDETGAAVFAAFSEVYRSLAEDRRGPNQATAELRRFFED